MAKARPDLVAERAAIVSERVSLHARVDDQRGKCKSVTENTDLWQTCLQLRAELQAALKAHIQRSNNFNQAVKAPGGSPSRSTYDCAQVPTAENDFISYGEEVAKDRQILQNFGFERTVEEMESWEEYGKDAQKKYINRARAELLGKAFDLFQHRLRAIETSPPVKGAEADAFRRLFESSGVKDQRLLDDLRAAALGEQPVQISRVTGALHQATKALELTEEPEDVTDQIATALNVATLLAPEAHPVLTIAEDANWLGYATYTHAKVAYGLQSVNKLTTLTEGQLKDLSRFAQKLTHDVDGLHAARKVLERAKSANCSSMKIAN